ncbi:SET domain-containing protein-lysine N-methyltransferase [Streptomyces sp. NRRL B-1347]|uniref:SET domain-containing protein-lysine N-methyltransferase n=1 Tax=Streptomyces sp. NRRL B-1347 TaxID=1476877 RepID=UPI000A887683|nr:SET domain-containing protein-lysine N-methyltransferase [Streptomyces sp. NRRL B-1347]
MNTARLKSSARPPAAPNEASAAEAKIAGAPEQGDVDASGGARSRHSFQKDWSLHIELDEAARSINHSCSPNTGVKDNPLGGYDFVALTTIHTGEEITWDYETTEHESIAVLHCLCGSTTRRGRTRGFKYRTDVPPYVAAYLRGLRQWTLRP